MGHYDECIGLLYIFMNVSQKYGVQVLIVGQNKPTI